MKFRALALAASMTLAAPGVVHAFCGFYVSGADASLYSNATMVVMMRSGTRTVLSMQNDYQGPPQDFAVVVPVPIVLQEENVKTLPREIFQRVDSLAAPRLVEYWEQDPCFVPPMETRFRRSMAPMAAGAAAETTSRADLGVRIEAQFAVGEYDIVILSARDSSGLDTWLRRERYNIPQGAGEILRPYVEQGTKFFVAKVDVERVQFVNGKAVLSPLRVHYDAPEFSLPVRLGLLNSSGQQDLIVHILSPGKRYEVANYPNVTIPTNIPVVDSVRQEFGGFYEALFRQTIAQNPGAVVTEYAWNASTCDPCPTPALDPSELMSLGGDVIGPEAQGSGFVLTRLHYRYDREHLGEDLVFRTATPIIGGRGMPDQEGQLGERVAAPSSFDNFQGRYVILHRWEGAIACANPVRGRWGGPPNGGTPEPQAARSELSGGGARTGVPPVIGALVTEDVPAVNIVRGVTRTPEPPRATPAPGPASGGAAGASAVMPASSTTGSGGCASCTIAGGEAPWSAAFAALALASALLWRRRRS